MTQRNKASQSLSLSPLGFQEAVTGPTEGAAVPEEGAEAEGEGEGGKKNPE